MNQSSKKPSKGDRVLEIARERGVISARKLSAKGIHREYLRRLENKGLLVRTGRGIYSLTDSQQLTENHSLVEASERVPHGIICLLSALRFHNITTQAPFEVWLAIDQKARRTKKEIIPLRIIYMSGEARTAGVEEHQVEGVTLRLYSLAKTVADCFKYRNKIGLDVALEALRESWLHQACTMDELWHYGKICRVNNVMRPYLESLT